MSALLRARFPGRRRPSLFEFLFGQNVDLFVHATERLEAAVAAGDEVLLRIDARFARRERPTEPFGFLPPVAQQRLPTVVRPRHLRQRLVVARETHEAHVARAELGEHYRRYLLLHRHRVERELRLVGPLALPALGSDVAATGLVVDDCVAAALEAVHAVDACIERHPAEDDRPLLLGGDDRERRPLLLDLLEPVVPEARALELGEAAFDRHLLYRGGGGALDRRREVALQRGGVLQLVPDVLHQEVHELAALRGVEAFGGLLELIGVQPVAREGAERARGLVGENTRAAADLFLPDGGRYVILKSLGFPGSEDHVAQVREGRNLDRLLGEVCDERARQDVAVLLLGGMREHYLAGGLLPAVGDAPVECERGLGARLGNAGLALLRERQEGIGRTLQRPGFVGQAGDPEVIELDACGLEQAQYLDRRIRRFRLEERIGADLPQSLKRLREGHLLRDSIEARQLAERFVPLGLRLELVRVESALARKAGGLEHAGEMPRPLGRRLLREQPGLAQRIELLQPRAQQRCLAGGGDQLRQDDARAELLTQPRLEAHARAELGLGTADKRRAHESARFFERDFLL